MHRPKCTLCAIIAMILLFGFGSDVSAQQARSIGYAVRAILPENQVDIQVSYFDLMVEPGQRQVLQVIVKNRENEDIEVAVEANTAFSNSNGVIEFSHTQERDESMVVDFAEIVTPVEAILTVPANGQAIAEFALTVPDDCFEGVVYGGLMFTMLNQTKPEVVENTMIQNIYRYVIGVRIRESETPIQPEFELTGAQRNEISRQSILVYLRNPRPVIARGISVRASVYPGGGGEAIFVFENDNVDMAPNSSMPYTLFLDKNQSLAAGTYRVTVEMRFEDNVWEMETPLIVE